MKDLQRILIRMLIILFIAALFINLVIVMIQAFIERTDHNTYLMLLLFEVAALVVVFVAAIAIFWKRLKK